MEEVVLSLGTNSGDRVLNMRRMEKELLNILDPPLRFSSLMETEHVGGGQRPAYYNQLIRGGYAKSPRDLLHQCQAIELAMGRRREGPFAPRTADIDILLFGNAVVSTPALEIPHPRFRNRRFVLAPLADLAPDLRDPLTRKTVRELLAELRGQAVHKIG